MLKYLVGGAVRDLLLGIDPKDRDWVVVGETTESMLAAGFKQVGADFPVFLHPGTGEEYALARTERKVGTGYLGFETSHDAGVTLDEDLRRRDLTINAMAMDEAGNLIDPHDGAGDLRNGVLRAVSEAFAEDPLRVLRVARFAARYGFVVEDGTRTMCSELAGREEFGQITRERVGKEMEKALMEPYPQLFFETLLDLDALHPHFPELHALVGQTQPVKHHPEGDAFVHTMLVLQQAVRMDLDLVGRFAALVHDLGKGLTPPELLPKHHGHEEAGVPLVQEMANRLRLSTEMKRAGQIAAKYHAHVHRVGAMNATSLARLAHEIGADHSQGNALLLSAIGECDARGRLGQEQVDYPEAAMFRGVMAAVGAKKFRDCFTSEQIAEMSTEHRKAAQARIRNDAVKSWMRENASEATVDEGVAPAM